MAEKLPAEKTTRDLSYELKELNEDGTFIGIASVMGIQDLTGDIISLGAFEKTIAENPETTLLWQHQPGEPIGKGRLEEKGKKIIIRGNIDLEEPAGQKAYRLLKKGLVSGLSIGFTPLQYAWKDIKGKSVRVIDQLRLWEVSIVTFPANEEAVVTSVKAADETLSTTISELASRVSLLETKIQPSQVKEPSMPGESQAADRRDHTGPAERSTEPAVSHSALLETASLIRSLTDGPK